MNYRIKQVLTIAFLFLVEITSSVISVEAASYGEGGYGSGVFNIGEISPTPTIFPSPTISSGEENNGLVSSSNAADNSQTSAPTVPVCNDLKPGTKTPWLYSAVAQDGGSILLFFAEADDPVDHYALEFGTESNKYTWGLTNVGGKGSRTYLVNFLQPTTTYYFRVRAGNGCAPGDWSNEISAKTKSMLSFKQLEIDEISLESGDATPSSITKDNVENSQEEQKKTGKLFYKVTVEVKNEKNEPVVGAKVIIHSEVKEAITDENGIARFDVVELGEHRVLVSYDGYEGEQSLNLSGENDEINITITVKKNNLIITPFAIVIMGLFFLLSLWVMFTTLKKKN